MRENYFTGEDLSSRYYLFILQRWQQWLHPVGRLCGVHQRVKREEERRIRRRRKKGNKKKKEEEDDDDNDDNDNQQIEEVKE